MKTIIHYTSCPVCNSENLSAVFDVTDYTVSGEKFTIVECSNCSLRFTQDVPGAESISPYYKSEDYISHTNTSTGLVNSLYQKVRKRTLKKKGNLVSARTKTSKGKLLDLGSGTGSFVHEMLNRKWDVTGLEPDEQARKVAQDQYNVQLREINDFYTLEPGTYDAITMWHVLEHVHDLHEYIAHLKSLLKETGLLFIAVPNYTSGDGSEYGEYWAAYDVPRHLYHFSPKSMEKLIESHGLKIREYLPMWYDSFYISLLSSKYKNATVTGSKGRPKLISAFLNGLKSNLSAMKEKGKCSSIIYVIGK